MYFINLVFYFSFYFVLATGSYVRVEGDFITENGLQVKELFIAVHVTKCTKDVLVKYRLSEISDFKAAFLSTTMKILMKSSSSIINCNSEIKSFIENEHLSIKRVSVYVIVDMKQTPSTTSKQILTPINLHSTSTRPTVPRATSTSINKPLSTSDEAFWKIDRTQFFNSINDYLESFLATVVTSLIFLLKPILFRTIRALAASTLRNTQDLAEQLACVDIERQSQLTRPSQVTTSTPVITLEKEHGPISPGISRRNIPTTSTASKLPRPQLFTQQQLSQQPAAQQPVTQQQLSQQPATQQLSQQRVGQQQVTQQPATQQQVGQQPATQQPQDPIYCKCTTGQCTSCRCATNNQKCNDKCHKGNSNGSCKNL